MSWRKELSSYGGLDSLLSTQGTLFYRNYDKTIQNFRQPSGENVLKDQFEVDQKWKSDGADETVRIIEWFAKQSAWLWRLQFLGFLKKGILSDTKLLKQLKN